MTLYSTLSHSKLRSWEKVAVAHGHNGRHIDVPNADPKKLGVLEVVDRPEQNLTDRIKGRLDEAGVTKIRKNAVLAFEDLYGASPGYWARQFPGGWENASVEQLMVDPLVQAVEAFARAKHGDNLVSIAWHFDEKSPHAHVISVPLVTREHARRGRKRKDGTVPEPVMKTTLAADQLRGGSKYVLEKEHDEWAAFVAHLGLQRGRRGSELSAEEVRERRLRDPQASRQGEEAARLREQQIEGGREALRSLVLDGARERTQLIDDGTARAAQKQAEAEAEAAKIVAQKRTEAEAEAVRIRAQAEAEAAHIRTLAHEAGRKEGEAESAKILAKARAEGAQAALKLIEDGRAEAAKALAAAAQDREAAAMERAKAATDRAETDRLKQEAAARETAIEVGLTAIEDGRIIKGGGGRIWMRSLSEEDRDRLKAQITPAWDWICRQAERFHAITEKLAQQETDLVRRKGEISKAEAVLKSAGEMLSKYAKAYNPMALWNKQYAEAQPVQRQAMDLSPRAPIAAEAAKHAIPKAQVDEDQAWLDQQMQWISGKGGTGRG